MYSPGKGLGAGDSLLGPISFIFTLLWQPPSPSLFSSSTITLSVPPPRPLWPFFLHVFLFLSASFAPLPRPAEFFFLFLPVFSSVSLNAEDLLLPSSEEWDGKRWEVA